MSAASAKRHVRRRKSQPDHQPSTLAAGAVMFTQNDEAYFNKRYQEELLRAESTPDESLRALHARWAELYRQRLVALLQQR